MPSHVINQISGADQNEANKLGRVSSTLGPTVAPTSLHRAYGSVCVAESALKKGRIN